MKTNHFLKKAFYHNNHAFMLIAMFFLVIAYGMDVAFAWLMQELFDSVGGNGTFSLQQLMGIFLVLFPVAVVAQLILRFTRSRFTRKALLQYKKAAMEKLLSHRLNDFKITSSSTYLSALSNDMAAIESKYLVGMFSIGIYLVQLVFALGMMFWYDWFLTIVSLVISLVPFLVSMLYGSRLSGLERKVSENNDVSLGVVKEIIAGLPIIKAFKTEKQIGELYRKTNEELEQVKYDRRMLSSLVSIISEYSSSFVQICIFFLGAYLAYRGHITVGVVIAFFQLMNYVVSPFQQLPGYITEWKAARQLIYKFEELLTAPVSNPGTCNLSVEQHDIALEHVSFAYEEGKDVLRDVNLSFEAAKNYAIVGPSGSGKSTLLNLLLHNEDGYRGTIRVDGQELREITLDSLYDNISVVQQNVFIFDSSIRDNITLFREFPEEEIAQAVKLAGLSEIAGERGLDYPCGEYGANLSGGERQRISIARCLLHHAPILLMDEATASLDAANTWSILSSLLEEQEQRMKIVVTHNLDEALLRKYDKIIVMRDGQVEEVGSFEELMQPESYFYSFYMVTAGKK